MKIANALLLVILVIVLLALTGWRFSIDWLKYLIRGAVAMNPLTAVFFVMLTAATGLKLTFSRTKAIMLLANGLLLGILLVTCWKLLTAIYEMPFTVDLLFFQKSVLNDGADSFINRMPYNTAFCFVISSIAVLLINNRSRRIIVVTQTAVLLSLMLAVFCLLGYAFGAVEFYEVQIFIPMAPGTAICFFLFSLAILFATPSVGLMQQFTSIYSGSYLAWRLFIPAFLLPFIIGLIRLNGQRAGLYNLEFGSALFVTSIISIFLAFIWFNTFLVNTREEKQMETIAEKNHLANLVEQTSDAILSTDTAFNIVSWNKGAEEIYGFTKEEVMNKPMGLFLRGTLSPETTQRLLNELLEKGFYTAEYAFYGKHQHLIDVQASVTVLRNANKEVTGYVAVHRDISQRKKLEQQLQEFNQQLEQQVHQKTEELREVFERILEAFLGIDNHSNIVYANKKAEQLFCTAGKQLMQTSIFDLFQQPDGEVEIALREALENREYIYLETYLSQFEKWFELHIYPSASGLSVYMRDITIRKQALRALNASEEKYRNLVEQAGDGILIFNAAGTILDVNESASALLGFTKDEMLAFTTADILNDTALANIPVRFDLLERGESIVRQQKMKNRKGTFIETEIRAKRLPDGTFLAIIRDLTNRLQAQQQLQKEKDLLDSIINSLPGVFYFYDQNGTFIRWNKKFKDVTEYSNEEIATMHPLDFFEGDDKHYLQKRISDVFTNGTGDAEAYFVTKSGKRVPYFFTGARIEIDHEVCLVGMGIDITDRKHAELEIQDSYQQIRRLTNHLHNVREEERAHIAREVHDELGQQLTVIKMDISWAKKKLASADLPAVENKMNEMLEILDGTVAVVRRIATELRPSLLDDIGLIAAIEWQIEVFSKRTGIKINLEKPEESLLLPDAYATGLFRILQESLTNITRHSNANQVDIHLKNQNKEFILCIKDNGQGFDMSELADKKTLGLLGMRERSNAMHGTFTIESKPGQGTTVEVRVPLS